MWSNGSGFAFGIEFFLVGRENSLLSRQIPDLSYLAFISHLALWCPDMTREL